MDDKVTIDREVFDKMVNVLAQLPYAQIAPLLAEIGQAVQTPDIREDNGD
jgi:hypothetical protein